MLFIRRPSMPSSELENSADAAAVGPFALSTIFVEQDHRAIKRRVRASQGFRSFNSAWRTLQGIETINMIRKGKIRWLPKDDILGQVAFVAGLFGVPIAA